MKGCLSIALWLLLIALAGVAVTMAMPLGHQPRNARERAYTRNAIESRHYLNNNPIAALLSRLIVVRTAVADFRDVPQSCDGGTDASLPEYADVVASVTDYTIFAIPLQRYETSCAGLFITRGSMGPPSSGPTARSPEPNPDVSPPPPPPQR